MQGTQENASGNDKKSLTRKPAKSQTSLNLRTDNASKSSTNKIDHKKSLSINQLKPSIPTSQISKVQRNVSEKNVKDIKGAITKVIKDKEEQTKSDSMPTSIDLDFREQDSPNKNEEELKHLQESYYSFVKHIEDIESSKPEGCEALCSDLKNLRENMNLVINETIIKLVPNQAQQFTSLIQTLQKALENIQTDKLNQVSVTTNTDAFYNAENKTVDSDLAQRVQTNLSIKTTNPDFNNLGDTKDETFLSRVENKSRQTTFLASPKKDLEINMLNEMKEAEKRKEEFERLTVAAKRAILDYNKELEAHRKLSPKAILSKLRSHGDLRDLKSSLKSFGSSEANMDTKFSESNNKEAKTSHMEASELKQEGDQLREQLNTTLNKLAQNIQNSMGVNILNERSKNQENQGPDGLDSASQNEVKISQRILVEIIKFNTMLQLDPKKQTWLLNNKDKTLGLFEGPVMKVRNENDQPKVSFNSISNQSMFGVSTIIKEADVKSPNEQDFYLFKVEVDKIINQNNLLKRQKEIQQQEIFKLRDTCSKLEHMNNELDDYIDNLEYEYKVLQKRKEVEESQTQDELFRLKEEIEELRRYEEEYRDNIERLNHNQHLEHDLNPPILDDGDQIETGDIICQDRITETLKELDELIEKDALGENKSEMPVDNQNDDLNKISSDDNKISKSFKTEEKNRTDFQVILDSINIEKRGKDSQHANTTKQPTPDLQIRERSVSVPNYIGSKIEHFPPNFWDYLPLLERDLKTMDSRIEKYFGRIFELIRKYNEEEIDMAVLETSIETTKQDLVKEVVICMEEARMTSHGALVDKTDIRNNKKKSLQGENQIPANNALNSKVRQILTKVEEDETIEFEASTTISKIYEQTNMVKIFKVKHDLNRAKEAMLSAVSNSGANETKIQESILNLERELAEMLKSMSSEEKLQETNYSKFIDEVWKEKLELLSKYFEKVRSEQAFSDMLQSLTRTVDEVSNHNKNLEQQLQEMQHVSLVQKKDYESQQLAEQERIIKSTEEMVESSCLEMKEYISSLENSFKQEMITQKITENAQLSQVLKENFESAALEIAKNVAHKLEGSRRSNFHNEKNKIEKDHLRVVKALQSQLNKQENEHKRLKELVNTKCSTNLGYKIINMLADDMIFIKEMLNVNKIKKKEELYEKLKDVKDELLLYNDRIKVLHQEKRTLNSGDDSLVRLDFFYSLLESYSKNYVKLKTIQSYVISCLKDKKKPALLSVEH